MSGRKGSQAPDDSMYQDSQVSRKQEEEEPVDVRELKSNLDESAAMLEIIKEFEKNYFDSKSNYNKLD